MCKKEVMSLNLSPSTPCNKGKCKGMDIAVCEGTSPLREITCHMGLRYVYVRYVYWHMAAKKAGLSQQICSSVSEGLSTNYTLTYHIKCISPNTNIQINMTHTYWQQVAKTASIRQCDITSKWWLCHWFNCIANNSFIWRCAVSSLFTRE